VPNLTDLPRLTGVVIHDHIKRLYKPDGLGRPAQFADGRPFFFIEKRSSLNAFWFNWKQELAEAKNKEVLVKTTTEDEEKFLNIGRMCVSNYWDTNLERGKPVEVERRYNWKMESGVRLVGIFDQVWAVSLEYIQKKRPELIVDGKLNPEYDAVVILDHKSEFGTYDPFTKIPEPTERDWAVQQFELHEYLQPAFYTWLYFKKHGKWPVGFVWSHLRTKRGFFTYRTERDFKELFHSIESFVDAHRTDYFPKSVGFQCRKCDFMLACRGDRPFLRAYAEEFAVNTPSLKYGPSAVVEKADEQLRLGIKVGRRKAKEPPMLQESKEEKLEFKSFPLTEDTPKPK
jgi:hypothetical protein